MRQFPQQERVHIWILHAHRVAHTIVQCTYMYHVWVGTLFVVAVSLPGWMGEESEQDAVHTCAEPAQRITSTVACLTQVRCVPWLKHAVYRLLPPLRVTCRLPGSP